MDRSRCDRCAVPRRIKRVLALSVALALGGAGVGVAAAPEATTQAVQLPVPQDDAYVINEDTEGWWTPQENDLIPPDTGAYHLSPGIPSHGRAWDRRYTSLVYVPDANFNGTDTFEYRLSDMFGNWESEPALITVTVLPVNDPPRADWDFFTGAEDVVINASVLANDGDIELDPLVAIPVQEPAHGTLAPTTEGFRYTPDSNWNGEDLFTYKASDHTATSEVVSVRISVSAVNDAPVAHDDTFYGREDQPLEANIRANDTDAEGTVLSTMKLSDPGHGTVIVNDRGGIYYVPNPNWHGTDTLTYKSSDGLLDSGAATISIVIQPANDAPVANADAFSGQQGSTITGNVLLNDSDMDGDTLNAIRVADTAHGEVRLSSDGTFTFTPDNGWSGSDSFSYRANDGTLDSNVVVVSLNVGQVAGPEMVEVYRFYHVANGTHFYTSDPAERASVNANLRHIYRDEGTAYELNPANNTQQLTRFYNRMSGSHFYTVNQAEADSIRATMGHIFSLDGLSYAVNPYAVSNSIPVYRFYNLRNGSHFYTADPAELNNVRTNLTAVYSFDGTAFWLGQ